jgi:hypothetical protein
VRTSSRGQPLCTPKTGGRSHALRVDSRSARRGPFPRAGAAARRRSCERRKPHSASHDSLTATSGYWLVSVESASCEWGNKQKLALVPADLRMASVQSGWILQPGFRSADCMPSCVKRPKKTDLATGCMDAVTQEKKKQCTLHSFCMVVFDYLLLLRHARYGQGHARYGHMDPFATGMKRHDQLKKKAKQLPFFMWFPIFYMNTYHIYSIYFLLKITNRIKHVLCYSF